eukprot:6178594-Karenia_brevis.AAC.1
MMMTVMRLMMTMMMNHDDDDDDDVGGGWPSLLKQPHMDLPMQAAQTLSRCTAPRAPGTVVRKK